MSKAPSVPISASKMPTAIMATRTAGAVPVALRRRRSGVTFRRSTPWSPRQRRGRRPLSPGPAWRARLQRSERMRAHILRITLSLIAFAFLETQSTVLAALAAVADLSRCVQPGARPHPRALRLPSTPASWRCLSRGADAGERARDARHAPQASRASLPAPARANDLRHYPGGPEPPCAHSQAWPSGIRRVARYVLVL